MNKNKQKTFRKLIRNQKLLLNLDWLTLNVIDVFKLLEFNESKKIGEFYCEYKPQRTSHFNKMLNLWLGTEKVAVVTFEANSKIILKDRAHIKIENHMLYQDNCKEIIQKIIETFSINSCRISRVDIACDGVNFHEFVTKYEINKHKYKKDGKTVQSDDLHYFRVNDLDNLRPVGVDFSSIATGNYDCFTVGSYGDKDSGKSKSYRFSRYYNKTKELKDKNHKEYITEYFKNNGLEGTIYRYEIEIRSAFLAQIDAVQWFELFEPEILKLLFCTANKNFFEWRMKDDSNVSRCTEILLFDDIETGYLSRIKRVVKDKLRVVKMAISKMLQDSEIFRQTHNNENQNIVSADRYHQAVIHLIKRNNLAEWFTHKYKYLRQDIIDRFCKEIPYKPIDIKNYQLNINYTNSCHYGV